ncbi:MAG: hypothetical protein ACKVZ0_06810 [Gemmatimonadales bacterium]
MGELERERPLGGGPGPDEGDGAGLRQIRQQADALLAAGDEAIRRALSSDSEAFLRANRQEGGQ